MQDIVHKKGKLFYSMGEVAEMFDVQPSLLRYWEKEFDMLKPHRNKKGNRLFTPKDVDTLKVIYHLLKEKKMKIEVARRHIRDHKSESDRDAEIVERLMSIRSMLQQVKQEILHGVPDDDEQLSGSVIVTTGGRKAKGNRSGTSTIREVEAEDASGSDPTGRRAKRSVLSDKTEKDVDNHPLHEKMLFEVVPPDDASSIESMIDSFIAKNYDPESDDEPAPEFDPFAQFADEAGDRAEDVGHDSDGQSRGSEVRQYGSGEQWTDSASQRYGLEESHDDKPKPTVIEQSLF